MPLCEALSSRRGQRPHHAPKDRVGTWDISWLAAGVSFVLGAAVRIAVADDARPREVGLRHSSCEACEQSRATCCGAGVLDADIRSFFDEISQEWLIRFLEHRIGDRRIIRLIQKWLKAGVLEDGAVTVSDRGTGQGSVISPLLANIYLHYALDL